MSSLLESISQPADLRRLSMGELKQLAAEIRTRIIEQVSTSGGHLASNLGVVELTLALHRVFDTPADLLVWDVGHQTYAHKLITGRQEAFCRLRQEDGLCGFPSREESPYDVTNTGHASTSLSQALGLRAARDLAGENRKVVVVMGDGALSGGMAMEALNNTGQLQKDLIMVLNDNEHSISRNVGVLARQLEDLRSSLGYRRAKNAVKSFLERSPMVGSSLVRFIDRLKLGLKAFILPNMLFESFGFFYIGPIDGHDQETLEKALNKAKRFSSPVLVHVLTIKGKGFAPAEKNPTFFHSAPPFQLASGEPSRQELPTYTDVVRTTMLEVGEQIPETVCITAAMADGTGLDAFARTYPDRFFDVGIAEEHALSFAAGLALGGRRPVVAIYSTFLQRAFDQLLHDISLQRLPVLFLLDRAGVVPGDGPTHQGIYDLSFLHCIPGLEILAPADGRELRAMIFAALARPGPVAIRYPKSAVPEGVLPEQAAASCKEAGYLEEAMSWGRGSLLREGRDLAFLALGATVESCRFASSILAETGIEAAVYNMRFLTPLDIPLLHAASLAYPLLITVEENVPAGGFGSAVWEELQSWNRSHATLVRLGIEEVPGVGSRSELLHRAGLDPEGIAGRAREAFSAISGHASSMAKPDQFAAIG
ncbi:MAG: 1-deoxy-D-xylulose-5-phosphate synthase [bacterium]